MGMDHPQTLAIRYNLASNLKSQGRNEESLHLFTKVQQQMHRVLGPEHPNTQKATIELAGLARENNGNF